jgi:hypothetical protein
LSLTVEIDVAPAVTTGLLSRRCNSSSDESSSNPRDPIDFDSADIEAEPEPAKADVDELQE